jgi:hypothetical protein
VTETLEHTARRIAEQGRDALLARLRPAFEEAAAAHRDTLTLDDEQLEKMVQRAADRADGLQWRRALASVATEQLGIGLGEALSHPAVARAQAIVGAPSYEEALGALGAVSETRAVPEPTPDAAPPSAPSPADQEKQPAEASDADEESAPSTAEHELPPAAAEPEPAAPISPDTEAPVADDSEPPPPVAADSELPPPVAADPDLVVPVAADSEPDMAAADGAETDADGVRLRAVHLGGIANLAPAEADLELQLSSVGLDIVRGPDQSVLGRLAWAEIDALETPDAGGRFRRKKSADAHLVVRSPQGSASFQIPGVTPQELREHLAPLIAQHK